MDNIDKIYYINLDHRKDRKGQIEQELKKMNIFDKAERFNAISEELGSLGCSKSHLEVLKDARDKKYKTIMIFEDDYMFLINKNIFNLKMEYIFKTVPNFDVFMLGIKLNSFKIFNNTIQKVLNGQTSSCYLIKEHYYDKLIKTIEESLDPLLETRNPSKYAYDQIWKKLQPSDNWYCFKTRIGKQREGYSDIEKRYVKYTV
jgi:glycosyl transferase family 25